MRHCDVLIAGAGPTGLVLALWLARQGVGVRILDKTSAPGTTSRALAVHARTLELYRQLDLADAVVARGHKVPAANMWVRGEPVARLALSDLGEELTPYPFLHIFPQDEHEALLVERLEEAGVRVERRTELLDFCDSGDGIVARMLGPGGEERCTARYIAGCDGAHSKVREHIAAGFPGGTYAQLFYVADVEARGASIDGELHIDLDESDFLAVFPLAGDGRARLIGTVRDDRAGAGEIGFEDVSGRAMRSMALSVEAVNWFSAYRVHHRVADRFRQGRAFILGDAAHIHSPVGGQGMNTGIGDAINLAWKLAAVLAGRAPDALLDSYEAERIGFARRLVATTDRAFSLATAEDRIAEIVRRRLVPLLLPRIAAFEAVREYMFRTVSQIMINYRGSPFSEGVAGDVHGGDRLPWVGVEGADNHAPLSKIAWQVHVYGDAAPALAEWCVAQAISLHRFDWREAHGSAGLARDSAYLLRPDGYVAVADAQASVERLERYRCAHGLRFAG